VDELTKPVAHLESGRPPLICSVLRRTEIDSFESSDYKHDKPLAGELSSDASGG
jgi:hypothetical protein